MRKVVPLFLLLMAGCATVPPPASVREPQTIPQAPVVEEARADVEKHVVERFGAAALARARAAPEFIAALRYPGMPMPPYDTDGHPIKPSVPTALLYRENGQWFAYGINGAEPVLPRWSDQLNTLLAKPELWVEPADGGAVGCTDSGGSYAWLRIADHPEQARIGHCGGSPLTEQLVSGAFLRGI